MYKSQNTMKGEKKMTTDIEIITVPDIMELYGFKRDEVYKLLKTRAVRCFQGRKQRLIGL